MSQQELKAALRHNGEEGARAIWERAESEAAGLRAAAEQTSQRQRRSTELRRQAEMDARQAVTLSASHRQRQDCRLTAEKVLAERIKSLAGELLEEMAMAGGAELFMSLAAEIPSAPWQLVVLHPRDKNSGRELFPDAEIRLDEKISAGLEVKSSDGRIRIINTLEKRLDHLWPELLPEILTALRQMAGDDEAVG